MPKRVIIIRTICKERHIIMAAVVTEKIIEMFLILLGGVIVYKAGLIDDKTVPKLSNLLLMFISPLLIFQSYQMEFEMRLFYGLLWTLTASAVTFAVTIVLSELLFRKKGERTPVEKIAVIYSNSGFIGLPLINGIIGSEGIFYMTAYLTVFNLLLWTHGVLVMGSAGSFKEMCKNLLTPTIIAIFAGVVCFVTQLRLPEVLANPIQMIGNMNTPLATIIAGANLAQGNLLKSLQNKRLYLLCAVKLILYPLVGLAALWLLHLEFHIAFTVFIGMACPAGASAIMFAERYGKDAKYASEIFVVTTVLSAISIPVLSVLAIRLLGAA